MMRQIGKILRLGLLLGVVLLAGCLQYDLDLQFDSQTHGQLIQQLHWRGSTPATNRDLQQWLRVLSDRAQGVGGSTQSLNDGLEIRIPFNNGQDLETKFNQFFAPADETMPFTLPAGDPIQATLSLDQGNRFLAIYNHVTLRLDLTAVPDLAETGLPFLQGQQLLTGRVKVEAPWVRSASGELDTAETWRLVPGEVNEIEADFWVLSPIGIGAVAIALFVLLGYGIKYGILPKVSNR
ncbi:DUF3153 domain-containing protein [Oscillatoria sp. CS-180]|uniref:DUF3153 domain-containing protein n=1 Tax=Oscillatoria sp. CS-180 TaxID=3021720 RepID=UPI00232E0EEA|nr:DUF3153 domain-containing protein [Oscillatoria sp. CS-180]MDB9526010.1 DUF3153 domain-containing protein [Oscillatoria sp. CS-180]